MEKFTDLSTIILFLGIMAFLVSCITEVLKNWTWLDKLMPTGLKVIILSVILVPTSMIALLNYYKLIITWYMVFASFLASFIVALIAMDGWERVTELANKMIKKK